MEVGCTVRGFAIVRFNDSYGVQCSLQKSSSAECDKIWLGCDDADIRALKHGLGLVSVYTDSMDNVIANTRMHLKREQVAELIPHLQKFVDTGEL